MAAAPDELQFLNMLLKLINAKNTIEIGVFTGYSLLATALALPHDGKVVAIDVNREFFEVGLPVIKKAGVEHKVEFHEGPALAILDQLLAEEKNKGAFDFIFVDADKANYQNYHEKALQLVKVGGLIAYDNTLWNGYVTGHMDGLMNEQDRILTDLMIKLNKSLVADPRVEICQLAIADGLTLCRRSV
ncbi:hypothetical protein LUZ60_003218 [Juncus effusus]|nr:hypothetical protein LUZ60_003218 [Juncus effusus]